MDVHLEEGLEDGVSQSLHCNEVLRQQVVDELGVRLVPWPHTHRALEHPRRAEPWTVSVDVCQAVPAEAVCLQNKQAKPCLLPMAPKEKSGSQVSTL